MRMSEAEKRRGSTLVLTDQISKSVGTPALHQTQCGASVRVNPRQVQFVGQSECCFAHFGSLPIMPQTHRCGL